MSGLKWNIKIIQELLKDNKKLSIIAAGISPSGWVHLGSLRELTICDYISYLLEKHGRKNLVYFFIDDLDPLVKIPLGWNLPEEALNKTLISLNQDFPKFKPIWEKLQEELLIVKKWFPNLIQVNMSEIYNKGDMNFYINLAIKNKIKINNFISQETSPETDFLPVYAIDKNSNRIVNKGKYKKNCLILENSILPLLDGGGKLAWKLDWSARWNLFKVDFEPCGKDVASSLNGANWVSNNIYKSKPPLNFIYEYILNEKGEKISKSKGGSIRLDELEKWTPFWNLQYWLIKRPESSLKFQLPKLVKNFELIVKKIFSYQNLPEEHKIFSLLNYIFPKGIPKIPISITLTRLLRIFSWVYIPVNVSKNYLFNTVKIFENSLQEDEYIKELLVKTFNFWNLINKNTDFTIYHEININERKSIIRILEFMKINVNDTFLIKNLTSNKDTREFFYLIFCKTKQGGPTFKELLKIIGRSKMIDILTTILNSGILKELLWEKIINWIEQ